MYSVNLSAYLAPADLAEAALSLSVSAGGTAPCGIALLCVGVGGSARELTAALLTVAVRLSVAVSLSVALSVAVLIALLSVAVRLTVHILLTVGVLILLLIHELTLSIDLLFALVDEHQRDYRADKT